MRPCTLKDFTLINNTVALIPNQLIKLLTYYTAVCKF